jgi:SPP1 family predicted phage head-tail adaptor
MNAGKLRHKVVIHNLTSTQSTATGEMLNVFTTGATIWVAIQPLSGREMFAAQQFISRIDTKITARFTSDSSAINAKSILTHTTGSVDYHVESVIRPEERGGELQIYAFRVLL